jgi:hypothetical protein
MLYRAAFRFLIMIAVLGGIRIGACSGPARHTNEGPLPVSTGTRGDSDAEAGRSSDETAFERAARKQRERMARARDAFSDSDPSQIRSQSDVASEELIRAMVQADRERRQAQYRPGEPMSTPEPSR